MSKYIIERWDVILVNSHRQPIIYIKPDIEFMNFIRDNNYNVICNISETGMVYDGQKIHGVVNESSYIPSCRPNYFDYTGFYVIVLDSSWNGYPNPNNLGKVQFSNYYP